MQISPRAPRTDFQKAIWTSQFFVSSKSVGTNLAPTSHFWGDFESDFEFEWKKVLMLQTNLLVNLRSYGDKFWTLFLTKNSFFMRNLKLSFLSSLITFDFSAGKKEAICEWNEKAILKPRYYPSKSTTLKMSFFGAKTSAGLQILDGEASRICQRITCNLEFRIQLIFRAHDHSPIFPLCGPCTFRSNLISGL